MVRYIEAEAHRREVDTAFMLYVAESLRLQGEGKYLATPLHDLITPHEDIDADSVIEHVMSRLNG